MSHQVRGGETDDSRYETTPRGLHFFLPLAVRRAKNELFGRFLVDTGASKCLITRGFAQALDVKIDELPLDTVGAVQGTAEMPVTKLDEVRVLGTKLAAHDVECWVGANLALGMNFLSHFKVSMEYGRRLVVEK